MLRKHIERIVRFPWTSILLTLFVTLAFALQFKNLFMVLDPKAILPQGHPYVQLNNEIEERFGGSRVVVIGVHSKDGDLFNPEDIAKIRRITEAVKKTPGILEKNVVSITDHKVKFVRAEGDTLEITGLAEGIPDTPEGMQELKQRVFGNPMFVNSLISKDGTTAAIITDFRGGSGDWWKKQQGGSASSGAKEPGGSQWPASGGESGSGEGKWPAASAEGEKAKGAGGQGQWEGKKWPAAEGGGGNSVEQWYVSDATIHQKLLDEVAKEKDDRTEIYLGGLPVALSFLEADSWRMTRYVYPLAAVVVMGVLYLAFRSFQGVFLPMACALLSVVWAVGLMGLFRIPLDPWNMMTPILILAVAAGHSVQILKRYYEELGTGLDSRDAVVASFTKIGPVMIAAGLVAAVSFASLLTFDLKTFQSFGLFTAFGILSAVILEMTFIPAARSLLKPAIPQGVAASFSLRGLQERGLKPAATGEETAKVPVSLLDRFLLGIARLVTERRAIVWAGSAVLIVAAGIGVSQLTVMNSLKSLFFESTQLRKDEKVLNQNFGGTATFYVYLEGKAPDALKDPAVLRGIEGLQRELEKVPEVGKTQSFVDYVKSVNQSLHGGDPAFRTVPEERAAIGEYLFLFSISGSQGEMDRMIDYEYKRAVIWVYLRDDSSALGERLVDLVQAYAKDHLPGAVMIGEGVPPASQGGGGEALKIGVAGSIPVMMALNQTMVEGKIQNILQIAAIVFVLSALVFRSLSAGLFVLIPLVVAVLVNFGILGWLGIGLGIGTAAISAMAVGFGADYAIYLLYRLREEIQGGEKKGSFERPVIERALLTAGKAIFFVALAISAGGVTLLFTGYYIHMEGFLIPLAMMTSCLAALILLPSLAVGLRPGFLKKS